MFSIINSLKEQLKSVMHMHRTLPRSALVSDTVALQQIETFGELYCNNCAFHTRCWVDNHERTMHQLKRAVRHPAAITGQTLDCPFIEAHFRHLHLPIERNLPYPKLYVHAQQPGNLSVTVELEGPDHREQRMIEIQDQLESYFGEALQIDKIDLATNEISFCSVPTLKAGLGVAQRGKSIHAPIGDSYRMMQYEPHKIAFAISDGMGTGTRAFIQSQTTLDRLYEFLKQGISETEAIHRVHRYVSDQFKDRVATIDFMAIDTEQRKATIVKRGGAPSFVKRGSKIYTLKANNLPIGIVADWDTEVLFCDLRAGDTVYMISDGVYDRIGHYVDKEQWVKRLIHSIGGTPSADAQSLADELMQRVLHAQRAEPLTDDLTCLAITLTHQNERSSVCS